MKRKERRKLKSNELSDFISRIFDLAKKRAREAAIAVGVIAFILIVFIFSRYIKGLNLQKQSQLLAEINEVNQELYENPEKIQDLEKLAGNGRFTRMGYIYLAKYHIEKEEFDKALQALENISGTREDMIYYQGQLLKAEIFYGKGQLDEALAVYQKIEQSQPRDFALDIVLFKQAELLEEKGNKDKALELYKKVSEDYPQTYYGFEASQKIEQ